MKTIKVFRTGKVIDAALYQRLQELDAYVFPGCGNEFLKNRDWWVIISNEKIIAYCGSWYSYGICMMCRAWVSREHRGKGLQRKMIAMRIAAAKQKGCSNVITYTTFDNHPSANNLIRSKFLLYEPAYKYAGEQLYFKKSIT